MIYDIHDKIRLKSPESFHQYLSLTKEDKEDYDILIHECEDRIFDIKDVIVNRDGEIFYELHIDDVDVYYINDLFIEEKVEDND